ncbi:MAG: glycosyltransferase [Gammaproteobacteria bacterium]
MHLALFARSLGGGGGAERVILQLAGALAERGHRVDLVLGRARGRFINEVPPDVRLIDLAHRPAPLALTALMRRPRDLATLWPALFIPGVAQVLGAIPELTGYLRRERPVALVSALEFANFAALLAIELSGQPTRSVVTVHNHLSTSIAAADRPHLRFVPRIARRLYPRADAIVGVSEGVARDLCALLGLASEKVSTIYNPVVTASMAEQAIAPVPHPWFAAAGTPVILGVGKLKRQKDFVTLIEAFALARGQRDLRLLILGEGPRRTALSELIDQRGLSTCVELIGFQANPYAFMSRAALFVLSSAWEGFGNVLVEAMACGCPVVSTDCPSGPAEILAAGRYGRLVPVGDADALARAMLATLDAPPPEDELRLRAAAFSAAHCAENYERLIRTQLGETPDVNLVDAEDMA